MFLVTVKTKFKQQYLLSSDRCIAIIKIIKFRSRFDCGQRSKYTAYVSRAGRYLSILVVPRYWNQTIHVSSKFQRNDTIDFGVIVVLLSLETLFEAKRLENFCLPGKIMHMTA